MDKDGPLEPLDDNPDEGMRLENDIMKLKLQAEFGAKFGEIEPDMPPELEQQFLQHVYDFEKAWQQQEAVTVASLLGNPYFTPFNDVGSNNLAQVWQEVQDLYAAKNISLDFGNEYPLEVKYRFATEELPLHQTMFVNMPGMILGFMYEEFHPNHAADMESRAKDFLEGWFELDAEKCVYNLSHEMVTGTGQMLVKQEIGHKLSLVFESFEKFENPEFFIGSTSYDMQEPDGDAPLMGMGYVEGGVRWKAVMENGDTMPFTGNFKFFLECNYDWWSIVYFKLPGWND